MILPILKKISDNFVNYIVIGSILAAIGFGYFKYQSLMDEIAFWTNKASANFTLYQTKEAEYEKQILLVKNINIQNKDLSDRLDMADREAAYYEQLSIKYQRELGKITTLPVDTVFLASTDTVYKFDPRDRYFKDYNIDNEVFLSGHFQPYDPFDLYITDLTLLSKLDIAVSFNDDDEYFWTAETNSKYLSVENVSVQFTKQERWKFFVMSNLYFQGFDFGKFTGIDLRAGLTKGKFGGNAGFKFNSDTPTEFSFGIMRFF